MLTRIATKPSSDPLAPRTGGGRRAPVQQTESTLQHTRLRETRYCQRAKTPPACHSATTHTHTVTLKAWQKVQCKCPCAALQPLSAQACPVTQVLGGTMIKQIVLPPYLRSLCRAYRGLIVGALLYTVKNVIIIMERFLTTVFSSSVIKYN